MIENPTLTEAEETRARASAATALRVARMYRPVGDTAARLFGRAADTAAAAGASLLVQGDVSSARTCAAAWAMLKRRETRAHRVRSVRLSAELKAVA